MARGGSVFKPRRGSTSASVSIIIVVCLLYVCYLILLQVSRVVSVNEGGGVSVRIPSRDSSLASVSV